MKRYRKIYIGDLCKVELSNTLKYIILAGVAIGLVALRGPMHLRAPGSAASYSGTQCAGKRKKVSLLHPSITYLAIYVAPKDF
jgi:hypothetical protein